MSHSDEDNDGITKKGHFDAGPEDEIDNSAIYSIHKIGVPDDTDGENEVGVSGDTDNAAASTSLPEIDIDGGLESFITSLGPNWKGTTEVFLINSCE
jgi:hypothetical protein